MAIANYTDLQTQAAAWAHRSDLSAILPDCVTLCEARLNDMLLLKNMESDEPLTLTANQNYVALPTGFVSPITFWLVIGGLRVKLDPALPQELWYSPSSSQPQFWAIDGANILFDCNANTAYSAFLRCIKASNLSSGNPTNYLLTKRPDVYLAGTLVEVARYTRDQEMFAEWESKFLKATAEVAASDNRNRGIAPLRSDIPPSRHRGNILRGD